MSGNDPSPAEMAWWEDLRRNQLGPRHAKRTPRRIPRNEIPHIEAPFFTAEAIDYDEVAVLARINPPRLPERLMVRVRRAGARVARGIMDGGRHEW